MMYTESVLLSHLCEKWMPYNGSSGVIIADNWVLTHGSVLHPETRGTLISDFFRKADRNKLSVIPKNLKRDFKFQVSWKNSGKLETREGYVAVSWICSQLEKTFDGILKNWSFGKRSTAATELAPVFLLIRINGEELSDDETMILGKTLLRRLYENYLDFPRVGSKAEIVSTPFGFPLFFNSVSCGIISNVEGSENCFFITDASTSVGSEGAPVYIVNERGRFICGLVISLSYEIHQSYTFGVNLQPCLRKILNVQNKDTPSYDVNFNYTNEELKFYDSVTRSVVAVQCGINWGTGIIIDKRKGCILTCKHVVEQTPRSSIKVLLRKDNNRKRIRIADATLVYATPNKMAYDVAVLRVDPEEMDHSLRDIVIGSERISQGDTVATVGYPFSSSSPTISMGNISKVSEIMIQTTCCVQNGISGGPLVRWPTGEMLGMVVCNIICPTQNVPLPRINFAIPATVLKDTLQEYINTDDSTVLENFTCHDESVSKLWEFSFPPNSKL